MGIRHRLGAVLVAVCLASTMPAAAQTGTRGRVVTDGAIIWRTDASIPLATVPSDRPPCSCSTV
jgi:hypothetical protein